MKHLSALLTLFFVFSCAPTEEPAREARTRWKTWFEKGPFAGYAGAGSGDSAKTLFEAVFDRSGSGTLPACTDSNGCALQCTATAAAVWECVDGTGASVAVTQGTGATAKQSPYRVGQYYLDDVTDASCPTMTPSTPALEDIWNGEHTLVMTLHSSSRTSPTYQHFFEQNTQNSLYWRYDAGKIRAAWKTPGGNVIADAPFYFHSRSGWSWVAARKEGIAATGTATYSAYANGEWGNDVTRTGAGGDPATGATGRWEMGCRKSNFPLRGGLESFTIYDKPLTDDELHDEHARWLGVYQDGIAMDWNPAPSTVGKAVWVEDVDGSGSLYPLANSPLTVDASGLLTSTRVQQYWAADARDATSWGTIGTPIVTADTTDGIFKKYETVAMADTVEDDDGAAREGVKSDDKTPGPYWHTASCYLAAGTSTKARLSLVTDGGGGADCDLTLTADVTRYHCSGDLTGSPTYVRGELTVGHADSDTGTIIVNQCQLDVGPAPRRPKMDTQPGENYGRWFPESDIAPKIGDINPGGSAEVVWSLDRPFPDGDGVRPFYPLDWANSARTQHFFIFWKYDTAQELSMRIQNPTCDPILDTETRGDATTLNFTEGQYYVSKLSWKPDGAGGLDHEMRHDVCANPATCTASTLVGSSTGRCESGEVAGHFHLGERYTANAGALDGHIYRLTWKDQ